MQAVETMAMAFSQIFPEEVVSFDVERFTRCRGGALKLQDPSQQWALQLQLLGAASEEQVR